MHPMKAFRVAAAISTTLALAAQAPAIAAPGHSDAGASAIGAAGVAAKADRTVDVVMDDNYYGIETLDVKAGETIRFVVRNEGAFLHEFALGTPAMHADHQKEMAMMQDHGMLTPTGIVHDMKDMDHSGMDMADMSHEDPNSVLVEPGQTAELVWTFGEPMELEFACNIPGHYESGMVGTLTVAHGANN